MVWRVLMLRREERPPIWRVDANILNKQPRTADKGGPPARGLGEVLTWYGASSGCGGRNGLQYGG